MVSSQYLKNNLYLFPENLSPLNQHLKQNYMRENIEAHFKDNW